MLNPTRSGLHAESLCRSSCSETTCQILLSAKICTALVALLLSVMPAVEQRDDHETGLGRLTQGRGFAGALCVPLDDTKGGEGILHGLIQRSV